MVSCRSSAVRRRSRSQASRSTMGSSLVARSGCRPGPGQGGHPARLTAHPHPVDLVGALLQQRLGDLGVAPGGQAQPPAGEGNPPVECVEAEPVLLLPVLAVHLQPGGGQGGHGVAGPRAGGALEAVEAPPQRGQGDQRGPPPPPGPPRPPAAARKAATMAGDSSTATSRPAVPARGRLAAPPPAPTSRTVPPAGRNRPAPRPDG